MNIALPRPNAALSTAAQCREMGIQVGDTIEGRETHIEGLWNEVRLTLLWLGEETAVWRVSQRWSGGLDWVDCGEDADWTLECRDWRKTGGSIDSDLTCAEYFAVATATNI